MNRRALAVLVLVGTGLCLSPQSSQGCNQGLAVRIRSSIQNRYRLQNDPDFTFLQDPLPSNVQNGLADLKRKGYEVRDFTDPSVDVSFVYGLKKDREAWRLCLSRVGPYATLFRLGRDGNKQLMNSATSPDIAQFITVTRYTLLGRRLLSCPAHLQRLRIISDSNKIRNWQALFREELLLP
jgi:hypothetical protein